MMDYHASITYTHAGHRQRRAAPSRPTTRAGSSGSSARCAAASTPAARATARSTRSSSTEEHEVDLPADAASSPTTRSSRRCSTRARPRPSRSPGCTCCSTAPTSILGYQPLIDVPNDDVRVGMRVAAVWASEAREGRPAASARRRQPRRLDPDRRARRRRPRPREQDLLMAATTRRHRHRRLERLADGAPHRQDRGADAARGDHRRGRPTPASPAPTSASPARAAATTSPAQAFAFVQTSTPSAPGRRSRESHVEMDGAWALYEAWVRLQHGDIDTALVDGLGPVVDRRPRADLPDAARPVLPRAARRRPASASPRCRPGRCSTRARSPSARSPRSRPAAAATRKANPHAQVTGDVDVDELLAERRTSRAPLRAHDLPPITDGAAAVVLAAGDRARELVRAARRGSRGIDHRIEPHYPGVRDLTTSPSTTLGGEGGRRRTTAPVDVAELHAPFTPRGADPRRGARPRRRRRDQPVGRRAGGQPDHGDRPHPHRRGRAADHATAASDRTLGARDRRARACSRTSSASWRETSDGHQPCAVVGIGQTKHKTPRAGTSRSAGLVREAAHARARRRRDDVDRHRRRRHRQGARHVRGRDDARAVPRRRARRGGQADVPRAHRRLGRRLDRHRRRAPRRRPASTSACSTVAFEKQSEGNAQWALGSAASGASIGAGGAFAPHIRAYIAPLAARPTTSARWSR